MLVSSSSFSYCFLLFSALVVTPSYGVSALSTVAAPAAASSSSTTKNVGGFRDPSKDPPYNKVIKTVDAPKLKRGMDYVRLGNSELIVSKVCMGTMTYGIQNTLEEGVALLDTAFDDYGINFLDTAEIYPIPPNGDNQGDTDRCVCEFLKNRDRKDVILATKVAGRSPMLTYLPRGPTADPEEGADLTRTQILDSVEESLKRLGTDYIDLVRVRNNRR